MAPDDPSPTADALATAAYASRTLRTAIRHAGLLEQWDGIALSPDNALINLGTVSPATADYIARLIMLAAAIADTASTPSGTVSP